MPEVRWIKHGAASDQRLLPGGEPAQGIRIGNLAQFRQDELHGLESPSPVSSLRNVQHKYSPCRKIGIDEQSV